VTDAVTVSCTRCGAEAAKFLLLPPQPGDKPAQRGLQRTGFICEVTRFGGVAELQRLLEMIRSADYAAAQGADADFVAFHCRECQRSYCQRCWRVGPLEFDEGFYDCTRAVCPEGHQQIVDD
jgi:hypothetical protein